MPCPDYGHDSLSCSLLQENEVFGRAEEPVRRRPGLRAPLLRAQGFALPPGESLNQLSSEKEKMKKNQGVFQESHGQNLASQGQNLGLTVL